MWIKYIGKKMYSGPGVRDFKPKERRNLSSKVSSYLVEKYPKWFKVTKAPVKEVIEAIKEVPGKIMGTLENKTEKDEKKKDDINIEEVKKK